MSESEGTENLYHLKMQGQGLGHLTKSNQIRLTTNQSNMGSFQVIDKGNALYVLKDVTSTEKNYCCIHDASTQSHNLVGWGKNAEASQWYIVEATDVEVALNTAGDASYATAYLPCSVSNVQVHPLTSVRNKVKTLCALQLLRVVFLPTRVLS